MPRCQRTFRRLPEPADRDRNVAAEAGRWTCPHCTEAESYEVVRDADLLQYARIAEDAAYNEFGKPGDHARATLFLYGLRPECVLEPTSRRYEIYLQQGSDALQLRLQIGHELFHRACSQGRVFHWTHEMLACLFSVRLLRRQGFAEYADQSAAVYREEAEHVTPYTFFTADLWAMAIYPYGFYGRAYLTGRALEEVAGWTALCRLARSPLVPGGNGPDMAAWIARLPAETQRSVRILLDSSPNRAEMVLTHG